MIKSTLNDVRTKIASLRAQTLSSTESKAYDFDQRIKEIKRVEMAAKVEGKEAKKRKKESERIKEVEGPVDQAMVDMMGFAGFGVKA